MVQTFQGYFLEDGRFVPDGRLVKLPAMRRAIVNILEDVVGGERSNDQHQVKLDRIKMIIADAAKIEYDILTDDDWDEMRNLRSKSNIGLSRAVEL